MVALAARLMVATTHEVVTNDSGSYLRLAENLASGGGYIGMLGDRELKFPPGYPAVVAALHSLGVPLIGAGRLVSAIVGAVLVLPMFFIGMRLGGPASAWLAATLGALAPPIVYPASMAIAEVGFATLAVGALAVGLRGGVGAALLAGLLVGGADLVKPEAFAFLLALLVTVLVTNRDRRLAASAALVAGFVVVAGPWIVSLNRHVEPFLLEGKSGMYGNVCRRLGSGLAYTAAASGLANGVPGPLVSFNRSVGSFVYSQELLADPRAFLACWVRNVEAIVEIATRRAYANPLLLLGAALGGLRLLVAGGRARRDGALVMLAGGLAVAQIAAGMVTMWIAPRYFYPTLVLVTIFAAAGVAWLPWPTRRAHAGPAGPVLVGLGLCLVMLWHAAELPREFGERLPRTEMEAGHAIARDAQGRRTLVMSAFSLPPFYARGDWLPLPHGGLQDVLGFARASRVDYVAFREAHGGELMPLLENPEAFGVRVVHDPAGPSTTRVVALLER